MEVVKASKRDKTSRVEVVCNETRIVPLNHLSLSFFFNFFSTFTFSLRPASVIRPVIPFHIQPCAGRCHHNAFKNIRARHTVIFLCGRLWPPAHSGCFTIPVSTAGAMSLMLLWEKETETRKRLESRCSVFQSENKANANDCDKERESTPSVCLLRFVVVIRIFSIKRKLAQNICDDRQDETRHEKLRNNFYFIYQSTFIFFFFFFRLYRSSHFTL